MKNRAVEFCKAIIDSYFGSTAAGGNGLLTSFGCGTSQQMASGYRAPRPSITTFVRCFDHRYRFSLQVPHSILLPPSIMKTTQYQPLQQTVTDVERSPPKDVWRSRFYWLLSIYTTGTVFIVLILVYTLSASDSHSCTPGARKPYCEQ